MSKETTLRIARPEKAADFAEAFGARGRVQISDVLALDAADAIHECLARHKEWNLVFTQAGQHRAVPISAFSRWPPTQRRKLEKAIYAEARNGFQYYYATVPIYDIYHERLLPGHFFHRVFEFLNSDAVLDFVRCIASDPEIGFADAQATRYGPGHFLTCHDDAVSGKERRIAYVLNLTPIWRPDWGGALQFFGADANIVEAYTPRFNALNLFRVPSDHSVGLVAPFAGVARYSITGWFRAGRDPGRSF